VNDPTTDTRAFGIKRLIDDAPGFFNVSSSVAAGGLYGQSGTLQVKDAYALILAWLGTAPIITPTPDPVSPTYGPEAAVGVALAFGGPT
jgi:hypothetical protein